MLGKYIKSAEKVIVKENKTRKSRKVIERSIDYWVSNTSSKLGWRYIEYYTLQELTLHFLVKPNCLKLFFLFFL